MKKLIIAIIAMATIAIAANKPVCYQYGDDFNGKVMFTCVRPTNNVKEINILLCKNDPEYSVTKIMNDGSSVSSVVYFYKYDNTTHVIESTFDDLGVLVHEDNRKLYGNQFIVLYSQLRDKYDIRRKK